MKRGTMETVLGAAVLALAAIFLVFGYKTANVKKISGYEVTADFSGVGGLAPGDDVVISGVKIGSVSGIDLDPDSYLAHVRLSIDPSIKLPDDTAALISSQSLLGGRYLALEPGASEDMLEAGGRIRFTQAPQNLEQLLGQFIFSMKDAKDAKAGQSAAAGEATEETVAAPETATP